MNPMRVGLVVCFLLTLCRPYQASLLADISEELANIENTVMLMSQGISNCTSAHLQKLASGGNSGERDYMEWGIAIGISSVGILNPVFGASLAVGMSFVQVFFPSQNMQSIFFEALAGLRQELLEEIGNRINENNLKLALQNQGATASVQFDNMAKTFDRTTGQNLLVRLKGHVRDIESSYAAYVSAACILNMSSADCISFHEAGTAAIASKVALTHMNMYAEIEHLVRDNPGWGYVRNEQLFLAQDAAAFWYYHLETSQNRYLSHRNKEVNFRAPVVQVQRVGDWVWPGRDYTQPYETNLHSIWITPMYKCSRFRGCEREDNESRAYNPDDWPLDYPTSGDALIALNKAYSQYRNDLSQLLALAIGSGERDALKTFMRTPIV